MTTAEATLDRIERLIELGAEVRLGKRWMHVVYGDEEGRCTLTCDLAAWEAYKASGRPMPRYVRKGLR